MLMKFADMPKGTKFLWNDDWHVKAFEPKYGARYNCYSLFYLMPAFCPVNESYVVRA